MYKATQLTTINLVHANITYYNVFDTFVLIVTYYIKQN